MDKPITIDFETEAIEDRPRYPPKPVGVSVKYPGRAPKYYAWGHPTENNCTFAEAKAALTQAYKAKPTKLFHNAKFDMDVAEVHMGLPVLPWREFHDTLFLLFLSDPHAQSLSLKPSAERLLNMPPEEQDAVKDWLIANVPEVRSKPSLAGAYICKAPGNIVGKYANGDVVRTEKLFALTYPRIVADGMSQAYDRERRLLPILLANERIGMRVDAVGLERDLAAFNAAVKKAEQWLFKKLGGEFNLDSDAEKAERLEKYGIVTAWAMTATGRRSTAKKNMTVERFNDKQVAAVLGYRDRMTTCIRMFGENWLELANTGDGHVHTNWNQVRQGHGNEKTGTRTGRPSTSHPNFLNVSKTWDDKDDGYVHPAFLNVPELPLMRKYLLPDKGHVWLHRDYNQQELRAAAHFEDGELMQRYIASPRMDVHTTVAGIISEMRGREIARRPVKITVFRKIYGGGIPATAAALNCTPDEARELISAINAALPGLQELERTCKAIGKAGQAITTWGGRKYFCEPAAFSKKYGRNMTFEYKLLNYLIQGSAADATKEALIRYADEAKDSRLLVTVYDEINTSAPAKAAKREMATLREAMESLEFDVPMLTDGKAGPSWGSLEKYLD